MTTIAQLEDLANTTNELPWGTEDQQRAAYEFWDLASDLGVEEDFWFDYPNANEEELMNLAIAWVKSQ